jgi:hypothetical protein
MKYRLSRKIVALHRPVKYLISIKINHLIKCKLLA